MSIHTQKPQNTAGGNGTIPLGPQREHRPRLGLALGAGAARGWSHIGVILELANQGIVPDIIAGTSIGAVVGGCAAAGRLEALESFARSLTKKRVFGLMDFSLSGIGLLGGGRLKTRLDQELVGKRIEHLSTVFAAVATEVSTGHEIWLSKGDLVQAIRASYALPGIFEPVPIGGRWLFDGALVNPVPVTVCRALGAEMVIAVNLISDPAFRGTVISDHGILNKAPPEPELDVQPEPERKNRFLNGMRGNLHRHFGRRHDGAPGIANAMIDAFNITQGRISRSRLAGDPPDVMINARLGAVGLFDFHRADELIAIGREAARRAMPDIRDNITLMPLGDNSL
ncbi:patatin-like phospholipase family protein [Methyloferula stellata]|uniref:patatin-like phospholipase family protein n=1 Tax=Methyloferula stellata TaxID=876270 RepID=UPI000362B3A0|nr:patatin-like phospholipase family protein [Methyloferula stellata]